VSPKRRQENSGPSGNPSFAPVLIATSNTTGSLTACILQPLAAKSRRPGEHLWHGLENALNRNEGAPPLPCCVKVTVPNKNSVASRGPTSTINNYCLTRFPKHLHFTPCGKHSHFRKYKKYSRQLSFQRCTECVRQDPDLPGIFRAASARSWARGFSLLPRFPCLPRAFVGGRATAPAHARFCRACDGSRGYPQQHRCHGRKLPCGAIRRSLRGPRHPCRQRQRQCPILPAWRLPLLPLPLLRVAFRNRHTSTGGRAGGLRTSVFHDCPAARASRLSRAVCGYCRAAPRASPLDLTDEQPRSAASSG